MTLSPIDREFSHIESQNRDLLARLRDQKRPQIELGSGSRDTPPTSSGDALFVSFTFNSLIGLLCQECIDITHRLPVIKNNLDCLENL